MVPVQYKCKAHNQGDNIVGMIWYPTVFVVGNKQKNILALLQVPVRFFFKFKL
jgi:hypothetical protein